MLFEDIGAVMLNSIKDTEKEKVVQEIFIRANIIKNWEEKYCTGNWYKTIEPMIMELSNFTRIPYYENTDTD